MLWPKALPLYLDCGLCAWAKLFNIQNVTKCVKMHFYFFYILIGMYTKIEFWIFWSHFVKSVANTPKMMYDILKLSSIILGWNFASMDFNYIFKPLVTILDVFGHFWTFWTHFVKLVGYTPTFIHDILKLSSIKLRWRLCFRGPQVRF